DELAESNKNLARTTIETLTVTKRVSRGGLLGWLGFTKKEVDQEATDLGLSIANGIFDAAVTGILEGGTAFQDGFQAMFERLAAEAALMTINFQERIANISKMIRDALADGVIDGNERAAIEAEKNALAADVAAERQKLVDAGIIKPKVETNNGETITKPLEPSKPNPGETTPTGAPQTLQRPSYAPSAPSVQLATFGGLTELGNDLRSAGRQILEGGRLIFDAATNGFVIDVNSSGNGAKPGLNRRTLRRA
ncbi:MAG: hypothetical protein ACRCVX_15105, partial [Shewanella sp.]